MEKMKWNEVKSKAMKMLAHPERYAYLYGTDGQTGTDELVDKQVRAFPDHFKGMNIRSLKDYVRGKICYDCSGFVHTLFGAPDMCSGDLISSCARTTTNLAEGVVSSVLWKRGHVGVDISGGCFVHFPAEFHSIEIGVISEYNWEKSGELQKWCDYTGADSL